MLLAGRGRDSRSCQGTAGGGGILDSGGPLKIEVL